MSWDNKRFIDFILLQRGYDLTKEQIIQGIYPVVTSTSIMGYHNAYMAEGPGVITGRSGTIGEVQYIEENYWPHNTSLYVKDFKGNHPRFVYYFMKNFGTSRAKSGSAVPTLNRNSLSGVEVCIPDIDTQYRIASILFAYDSLIETNQRQIKLLEEAAQRLYREWFVDLRFPGYEDVPVVDGVPEGWREGTIQEIVEYHDKTRKPLSGQQREKMKGNYRYYGAAGILDYVNSFLFDGTYLLFGEDGTVITNEGFPVLQYVSGQFWVNNHAHVLTGRGEYSTEFLYMKFSQMGISDVVTGVAQPKISQGRLSDKKTIIPEASIVRMYSIRTKAIFENILLLERKNNYLSEARNRILPKLMSGEIAV